MKLNFYPVMGECMKLKTIVGDDIVEVKEREDGSIHIFMMTGDIIKLKAEQHGTYDPQIDISIDYKNKYTE